MPADSLKLFSFHGKTKILHLTWLAFFICFFAWFNHAPLLMAIADSLSLTSDQIKTLLILNVALTIPARIVVGMLTDKYGPRRTYSALLLVGSLPCFIFALADSFAAAALGRFLLGFIGAAFVIGIRMVSEWFPARQLGTAEGIYGGWGNFGSAAAAICLPGIALLFGGEEGWRYAVALTGLLCLGYGFIYYFAVTDTPKGSTYFKPKKSGAMEVTSRGDLLLLLIMRIPLYAALALLTWKLSADTGLLSGFWATLIYYGGWPLYLAVAAAMTCALFAQAGSGAVFAMVPLIKRRLTGQIAGMTGAYGNVGAVFFLTVLSLVSYQTFFLVIAASALLGFVALFLLEEPEGHMAEVLPDGSVSLIDVA